MSRPSLIGLATIGALHCSGAESEPAGASESGRAGTSGTSGSAGTAAGGEGSGGAGPSASGGSSGTGSATGGPSATPDGLDELRVALSDHQFDWESFQTSSNASDQVFNQLILCGSGAFGLRQQTNSFFPGSGSVQGEDEYAGRWTLVGAPGAARVRLEVMSSTDSDVDSPLDFGVVQQDGAFTFDDNFGYANTNAATMSDASAACAASGSDAGGSGAGGSGPTPEMGQCDGIPAPQDACEQCLVASCCAELQACVVGTACGALLECSNVCPALDDTCVQSQCAAGVEAGVADVNALVECNATCSASCG